MKNDGLQSILDVSRIPNFACVQNSMEHLVGWPQFALSALVIFCRRHTLLLGKNLRTSYFIWTYWYARLLWSQEIVYIVRFLSESIGVRLPEFNYTFARVDNLLLRCHSFWYIVKGEKNLPYYSNRVQQGRIQNSDLRMAFFSTSTLWIFFMEWIYNVANIW